MGPQQTQNYETDANPISQIWHKVNATLEDERWLGIFFIVSSGGAFVSVVA